MIESWVYYICISIAGLVFAELLQKVSLSHKSDISSETNNFLVWSVVSLTGLISSIFFNQFELVELEYSHFFYLAVIGIVYFWAGTLFYASFKGISVGEGSTLLTISVAFSTILGVTFLGEQAGLDTAIGISLILISIAVLNYERGFKINKFALLALGGGIIYGLAYTLDKFLVLKTSPYFYLFIFALSITISSLVFKSKTIVKEVKTIRGSHWLVILFAGLAFGVYNLFTFFAYEQGASVGVANALNLTSVFWILSGEYIFLKARKATIRKLVAASIAVIGVTLLILF